MADEHQLRDGSGFLSIGKPSRRETLAGLGLGVAGGLSKANAAETASALRVEKVSDPGHQSGFGLDISLDGRLWRLRLGAFGPDAAITGFRTRGDATMTGLTIEIGRASFLSAGSRYTVSFDLEQASTARWSLTMRPGAWLEGYANGTSKPVDLLAFLGDEPALAAPAAVPTRPTFNLSVAQAQKVRERLFGDRLQVLKPLLASFTKDGSWTFSAQPKPGCKAGSCDPEAMVVLKSAGYIDNLRVRIVEAEAGPGAGLSEFRRRRGERRGRTFALLGTADFVASRTGLVMGEGAAAPLTLRAKPAIVDSKEQPICFALRHAGDPERTVAMLRAAFDATLAPPKGAVPPAFAVSIADGLLTRQRDPSAEADLMPEERRRQRADAEIRHRLRGIVAEDDRAVQTAYGVFGIAGDPIEGRTPASDGVSPDRRSPGADAFLADFTASLPLSGTTALAETVSDGFTAFEIRALVKSYDLALLDKGDVWSRLDFDGTETAFVLSSLVRREGAKLPLNAAGIVEIGAPAPDLGDWSWDERGPRRSPVEIALDGARLKARRASDLLALDFQFARLALQVRPGAARLIAATRRSVGGVGKAALGQTPVKRADGKTAERPSEAALAYDNRAKLIVTFPPQHVAEQAYLRQVNDGIPPPHGCLRHPVSGRSPPQG